MVKRLYRFISVAGALLLTLPGGSTLIAHASQAATPIHKYTFDTNLADSAGQRNPDQAQAPLVDGVSGTALRVENGKGLSFSQPISISENDPWSVSYWVRSDAAPQERTSVLMDNKKDFSFDLKLAAGRQAGFHVGKGRGDVLTFKYDFAGGTWYHLAWTQSKTAGMTMYVNGQAVDKNSWTKNHRVLIPADVIGGTGFTGAIDELAVYNSALSAADVKALYDKERPQNPAQGNPDQGKPTPGQPGQDTPGKGEPGKNESAEPQLPLRNTIPEYKLDDANISTVMRQPGGNRQYLGQPDLVQTKTGRLISAFPAGHGKGPLVMMISDDQGQTWTEKTDTPKSWTGSQETPTLYSLIREDGSERLMLITANPGWGVDKAGHRYGWNTSYSDDNGETWSEYTNFHPVRKHDGKDNAAIVAMASLVQLRDDAGQPIQKWMGVYHDYNFVNYKTYLTFEDGVEKWSDPVPYLAEHRDIEKSHQMCEIGMFRSPDGKQIVGLARSQSHAHLPTMIVSKDEGKTWSKPVELPGSLAGERHKPVYDPVSGRVVVPMREIRYDLNGNGRHDGASDWKAGNWVAWVGTFDDLMQQRPGQYRILLERDWSNNRYGGDTGYTGITALPDGTFIMHSYGHWDKDFSHSWKGTSGRGYDVRTDLAYIKQAKFTLAGLEQTAGIAQPDPKPTPSVTTTPTAKPAPSPKPVPSATPTPSVKPTPTAQPTPTVKPAPTKKPDPTVQPTPTVNPDPTPAPTPSATDKPTPEPGKHGKPGDTGNVFYLSNDWVSTVAQQVFSYGRAADQVLIGDWDGDGKETLAVRRGNQIFIQNSLTGGVADEVISFGRADDTIVVGDWDGDGKDTFAVRRGNQVFVLNSIRSGDADQVFSFGRDGDVLLAGDFDGDGKSSFAVQRGNVFFVNNTLTGGKAETSFSYGKAGDQIFVGDWDGDGKDTFAVRRGNQVFVANSLKSGNADITLYYGRAGDQMLVGDWDGDGVDTPIVRR
ncbi:LamG-like jellyroll fold domain-containing protein [Actinotignum sp. GS-2025b]|uniref:LamG-like jellyroll fold domain-containing protein n=1 Tax=Actinotignum sp. GS-2025b TaxID=3427275 RepID=UPI003F47D234